MRRTLPSLLLILLAVAALGSLGACNDIKRAVGWTTTVTNPDPESPEGIIQRVIKSGMNEDAEAGWKEFRAILHSNQHGRGSLSSWKANNYQTLRRKVHLYTENDAVPTFEIAFIEEVGTDGLKVQVINEMSDMPTPCKVRLDPKQGGAWRVEICSL